ncbi:unnamed protein product, partial [Rotaria sordida]
KYGLYRVFNIDLNEKRIQSVLIPSPLTSQLKESVLKQKKKIIEKQEQSSTSKSKHTREHSGDKELLSPADEEENRSTSSTPSLAPPVTAGKPKNSQNNILIDDKSTKTHYLSNLMKEIQTSLK